MVQDSFFDSAYDLPKETAKKVFKALRNFLQNPEGCGLHKEKLNTDKAELWSLRVDDDYRIIYHQPRTSLPIVLFVGKHDIAYRYAARATKPAVLKDWAMGGVLACRIGFPKGVPDPNQLFVDEMATASRQRPARVDLDHLESLVTTRKYLPLAQFLLRCESQTYTLTFSEIEGKIGNRLPPSARKHRAWWGNESVPTHSQAMAWMTVGWRVDSVEFEHGLVKFVRTQARAAGQ